MTILEARDKSDSVVAVMYGEEAIEAMAYLRRPLTQEPI